MSSFMDIPGIEETPLQPPPKGIVPDFSHHEDRSYQIYVAAAVCLPVMLIFASLRLWAKALILRAKTRDDYVYVFSLGAGITYIALLVALFSKGAYGWHAWEVLVKDLTRETIRLSILLEAIYGPIMWIIKLSLFLLYLQVFGRLRWLRYCVIFGITFTGLFYFSIMIAQLVLCAPPDNATQLEYLSAIDSAKCTSRSKTFDLLLGGVNIANDIYLLILPIPAVWSLKLPARKRFGVLAIFMTGIGACVSSILALVFRIHLVRTLDNTWTVVPLWIVTTIEMTAGVIIPCMASTTVVYRHIKAPLGLSFSKYGSKLRALITSSRAPSKTEGTDSTSGFQLQSSGGYKIMDEPKVAIAKEWPVQSSDQAKVPPIRVPAHAQIRKTTELHVTRHCRK